MSVYIWEGKNRNNIVQKGEMEASSQDVVRANLNKLRITPSKIKKKP